MGSIRDYICAKCGGFLDSKDSLICRSCSNKPVISENEAATYFLKEGYEVASPLDPKSTWDVLVRKPGTPDWRTVQVKTAYIDKGKLTANLSRNTREGRQLYSDDIHWFFVVYEDARWLFWNGEVPASGRVYLDKHHTKRV